MSLFSVLAIVISLFGPAGMQPVLALNVPQPQYPANYATTTPITDPPLGLPTFSWTAVNGTNQYRLQIDTEIGFNEPIALNITTRNTLYTPDSIGYLFGDIELYWRVRVEDPAPVGQWSPIMRFTKTWATPDNKPSLIVPANNATIAFYDAPAFSWSRVIGAARYRLQFALTSGGFDTPLVSIDTLMPTFQPAERFANGTYYWRVLPLDTADHLGTPSEVRSFILSYGTYATGMVPEQLTPANNSFPIFTPSFSWKAIDGAGQYRLEYTSDETCDFSIGTVIITHQTTYIPSETFPNDVRYCWRVRVEAGPAIGDWSQTWFFQKNWNLQPVLLTPTNLYQTGLFPIYSWTPVPGAASYQIDISKTPDFTQIIDGGRTANTIFTHQSQYIGTQHYYWRVRPYDGGEKAGLTSSVNEYQAIFDSLAPVQVYPLYYYPPNSYGDFTMNPYEDRTVSYPVFIWHRVLDPYVGGVLVNAYRVQVDTTPYFTNPIWIYDTENTSATPTEADDFNPVVGQNYFWRVCPLDGIGGSCLINESTGLEWWSQIWKARFDESLALDPTAGPTPELLRPAYGQEAVDATPMLEWWPLQGATQYEVEASFDADFSNLEFSEIVDIPIYSPATLIAQRNLGRLQFGTYYWRVRGLVAGVWSDWSDPWRFQIASQSDWMLSRTLGNEANRLQIGEDPAGDAAATYDLTYQYAAQSSINWYLGFNANLVTPNMTYVIYIDVDHEDGSGATLPPERGYQVTTIPAHQPEFVIYVDKISGSVTAQNTWVYAWNGSSWGYGQRLNEIGGGIYTESGFVEIQLPYGAIGMSEVTQSMALMVFSVNTTTNQVEDTVPSDPAVPGSGQLSRFSSVSERMNLIVPPNTVSGDPTTVTTMQPFAWDWPTGSNGATPFAGSTLEIDLDPDYTPPHEMTMYGVSSGAYFGHSHIQLMNDIQGDNIYFWRVRPRYQMSGDPSTLGAWTSGWSFRRVGATAQNLQTSISIATPTFSWDMTEGARSYNLQVSMDPNFGSSVINVSTPLNQYTPQDTLPQGLYYWRVKVVRYPGIDNDWSEVHQFSLSLPLVTGLTPNNETVSYNPTFCWDPMIGFDGGVPIMAASRYQIQVSRDPNFSSIYDQVNVVNHCYTSGIIYEDGTYYWHVAWLDGNNRVSYYSETATFTKQYPITTLISPIGGMVPGTPTFIWTPVDGAATYRVEISQYPTFYPTFDAIETINIKYTPLFTYPLNKVYYWRVAIRDRNGRMGPYTDATVIIGDSYKVFLPMMNK